MKSQMPVSIVTNIPTTVPSTVPTLDSTTLPGQSRIFVYIVPSVYTVCNTVDVFIMCLFIVVIIGGIVVAVLAVCLVALVVTLLIIAIQKRYRGLYNHYRYMYMYIVCILLDSFRVSYSARC